MVSDYKEKKVGSFMYTGFFKEYMEDENFECFGFLENHIVDDDYNEYISYRFNAENFLHGMCFDFALTLAERYNYNIEILDIRKGRRRAGKSLVHAYCTKTVNDIKYYMDIRGITTDKELFFEDFEEEILSYDHNYSSCYLQTMKYPTIKFYNHCYPKDKVEYGKEALC